MKKDLISESFYIEDLYSEERPFIVKGCECLSMEDAIKKYHELKKEHPFNEYDIVPIR